MSSPAVVTEPEPSHINRHILKLFHRVGDLERRLTAIERGRRRKPARQTADQTGRQLAARDKAIERRRQQRERDEMKLAKLEPLSGVAASASTRLRSPGGSHSQAERRHERHHLPP